MSLGFALPSMPWTRGDRQPEAPPESLENLAQHHILGEGALEHVLPVLGSYQTGIDAQPSNLNADVLSASVAVRDSLEEAPNRRGQWYVISLPGMVPETDVTMMTMPGVVRRLDVEQRPREDLLEAGLEYVDLQYGGNTVVRLHPYEFGGARLEIGAESLEMRNPAIIGRHPDQERINVVYHDGRKYRFESGQERLPHAEMLEPAHVYIDPLAGNGLLIARMSTPALEIVSAKGDRVDL